MSSLLTSASCRNKQCARIRGCCLQNSLIFIKFAKNIPRESSVYIIITAILSTMQINKPRAAVLNMNIHDRPTIPYRSFANGDLHRCKSFQWVSPQNKNKRLNCLFKYSASATLQVYALNSAIEQLCCPSVNISHLFGEGSFMTLV